MNTNPYFDILNLPVIENDLLDDQIDFFEKHKLLVYVLMKSSLPQSKQLVLMSKLHYKKIIKDLSLVTNAFKEHNIDYRVLKGVGISETYDQPFSRQMGDHDILVQPVDFKRAQETLEAIGYTKIDSLSTYKDISLLKKGSLMIELHHAVLNKDREFFAEDLLASLWVGKHELVVNDTVILTPNVNEHFRYIMIHMMKHLKVSGFGIRHLLDVKYFQIKNGIIFEDHINFFNEMGYGVFYKAVISLCYYKFNVKMTSNDWLFNEDDVLLQILEGFISDGGIFGAGSERLRINKVFRKYGNQGGKSNQIFVVLKSLFPKSTQLNKKYNYARHNILLLPIAWAHRFIDNFTRKDIRLNEKFFFLTRDINYVDEIDFLMKEMKLDR